MTDVKVTDTQVDSWRNDLKGEVYVVESSVNLKTEKFEWCELQHGLTNEGDYVWHFSSHHPRRLFPKNQDHILRIIVTFLDKVIPDDVVKSIFPSPADWDKKVITVKAIGFGKKWNFDQDKINGANAEIGLRISKEIEIANPPRKFH